MTGVALFVLVCVRRVEECRRFCGPTRTASRLDSIWTRIWDDVGQQRPSTFRQASAPLSIGLVLTPMLMAIVFAFNGHRQRQQGPGQLGLRTKKSVHSLSVSGGAVIPMARQMALFIFFASSFRSGRTNRLFFFWLWGLVFTSRKEVPRPYPARGINTARPSTRQRYTWMAQGPRSNLGQTEQVLIVWTTTMTKEMRNKAGEIQLSLELKFLGKRKDKAGTGGERGHCRSQKFKK